MLLLTKISVNPSFLGIFLDTFHELADTKKNKQAFSISITEI